MKTILRSEELSCPSCVAKIEKKLSALKGVQTATVHFATGKIVVEHDPNTAPQAMLVEAVRSVGYESRVTRI